MRRRFLTLDVFTRTRLAGNPLGMVLDSEGLDTAAMQAIAREFNHPETVFVWPAKDKAHRAALRIFTPLSELPFAGHPTVGAAVGLARLSGGAGEQKFVLEETIGPVSCVARMHDESSGHAVFDLPRLPELAGPASDVAAMAAALGLQTADIDTSIYPPARWSAGVALTFVAVKDLETIARAKPDMSRFESVFGAGGPGMVYLICAQTAQPGHHLHARMFAPGRGIAEDPATGSAAAAFAGIHVANARPADGVHRLVIEQGFEMGRPSLIELSLTLAKGALTAASIGGDAVVVTEGHLAA